MSRGHLVGVPLGAMLVMAGCITHLPPTSTEHMQIRWAASFEAASREALERGKPILACLVAGEIAGPC